MSQMNGTTPKKVTIGITMGEPRGIGAEVIIKALADRTLRNSARFVIYGVNELMTYTADQMRIEPFWSRVAHDSDRASHYIYDDCVVLDFPEHEGLLAAQHTASKAGGLASKAFVEEAINDAMSVEGSARHIDAVVTGPICKQSWAMAGFNWPGHTELFGHRTKAKRQCMMFVSPRLRVVLATTHVALMDIRNTLTIGKVFDPIDLGHEACKMLGIERPKIAVLGLNPHAGEGGQFGDEEARLIGPAIKVAQDAGIDARGPYPADTLFIRAAAGDFDLVVAMYHDQGLIPVKLLGWDKAVNWTLGLPIVRTSPDHGTGFDIASKFTASEGSMRAAIELAVQLAKAKVGERGHEDQQEVEAAEG
ncbi:MAG TPA: 4-hydroxythreonine-4-phosphate dehydrogenase PdxA [Phycisphaerales bacterium]|nr:4-hydroxythreonine-4-phosphate dehydrogenase PdxA [Phycisphaerales bacterium]